MSYKNFSKIDKVINQTAKNYNLESALYRHKALKYWHEIAAAFIEQCRELTQAVDLKKGILTVACLSREIASKIRLLSERITQALNQVLGRQVIYAIHIEA